MSDFITTQEHKCEWVYNWSDDYYEGGCGITWVIFDGTLEENGMFYCPKCGGHILQKEG